MAKGLDTKLREMLLSKNVVEPEVANKKEALAEK